MAGLVAKQRESLFSSRWSSRVVTVLFFFPVGACNRINLGCNGASFLFGAIDIYLFRVIDHYSLDLRPPSTVLSSSNFSSGFLYYYSFHTHTPLLAVRSSWYQPALGGLN